MGPWHLICEQGETSNGHVSLNLRSPIIAAIRKGVTSRIVTAIKKLAESDAETFLKLSENFGAVLKEGMYEDSERRAQLLAFVRFKTSTSGDAYRSFSEYLGGAGHYLLPCRRQPGATQGVATSGRFKSPRRRGSIAGQFHRQLLDDERARVRG